MVGPFVVPHAFSSEICGRRPVEYLQSNVDSYIVLNYIIIKT